VARSSRSLSFSPHANTADVVCFTTLNAGAGSFLIHENQLLSIGCGDSPSVGTGIALAGLNPPRGECREFARDRYSEIATVGVWLQPLKLRREC
jgi:hypothetical protein